MKRREFITLLGTRAAQTAERKYYRPKARPFRLGFPRKVPMFPICPPAALPPSLPPGSCRPALRDQTAGTAQTPSRVCR